MEFNSFLFLGFFVIIILILMLTNMSVMKTMSKKNSIRIRHSILLVASYIFYGWWDIRFVVLLFAMSLVAYFSALGIEKSGKKIYRILGVVIPLVTLGIFKYFNFFLDSLTNIFDIEVTGMLDLILPIGISFYTFQAIGYTVDVHRKKISAEKSFLRLALFIAFFPKLATGPIVKSGDFLPQLSEERNVNFKNLEEGVQCFVFGLFKKIVIADHISVCVDTVFFSPQHYHFLSILFAVIGYSIQIYCDFSGYSDMAIGCAKCLGYDLKRNFNIPYFSTNISMFWKRWHISLSNWLMEYLYIPLGGSWKGKGRTYINLFLTMILGGLWHGASWNFVIWGAIHGVALCIHKAWMYAKGHNKYYQDILIKKIASGIITYVVVLFGWIYFRTPDFQSADKILKGLLSMQQGIIYISTWVVLGIVLVLICSVVACLRAKKENTALNGFYPKLNLNTVYGLTIFFVEIGLTLGLAYTNSNPFIYSQF